jgi:hypothetical protein
VQGVQHYQNYQKPTSVLYYGLEKPTSIFRFTAKARALEYQGQRRQDGSMKIGGAGDGGGDGVIGVFGHGQGDDMGGARHYL